MPNIRGFFNDTAPALTLSGTDAEARLTPNRGIHVNLRSQNGVEFGTNGNPIFTKVATLFSVGGLDLDSFTAGVQNFAAIGGVFNDGLAAVPSGFEAENRITAFRAIHVNLRDSSGNEVIMAGSPTQVVGNVAAGSSDSGNPVKIGGVAKNTIPTGVSDGQRVDVVCDLKGRQVVTFADRALTVRGPQVNLTTITETTILAAAGAGIFNDLTTLIISNPGSAQTITIRDTTGGTAQFAVFVDTKSNLLFSFDGYPADQTTANTNWTAQLSAGSGANVLITAQAVKRN